MGHGPFTLNRRPSSMADPGPLAPSPPGAGATGEVARFVELITRATGNSLPASRDGFLREVLDRRTRATGFPAPADYLRALAEGELRREWENLIPLITIKESFFFRAPQQFEAIAHSILPRLLRSRAGSRHLRIWSVACARGEEPATLAMVLSEQKALAGWDWSILATDIDEDSLAGARRGLYGDRSVAQVPPPLLARYFTRRGKLFELVPELGARIDYRPLNLAHPPYVLPLREYDLVLLRNVLIYFPRPLQSLAAATVTRSLARKGFLFLGASETLWQIQDDLEAVDLGTCFCYRHRRPRHSAAAISSQLVPIHRLEGRPVQPGPPHQESQSIQPGQPAQPRPPAQVIQAGQAAQPVPPGQPNQRAMSPEAQRSPLATISRPAALGQDAAAVNSDTPGGTPDALDSLAEKAGEPPLFESVHERLLAAARELAANRIAEAERAIDQALAADPSEPAAHALEGFVHDLSGRTEEGVTCYRAALYLDPSLYQVRMLLADCLLRLGRRDLAEHHFREVLSNLNGGRERSLPLDELPLPDRDRVLRRCRQALSRPPR